MTNNMPPQAQGRPDDFQTPPAALVPLLPFLKPYPTIWEPAAGTGNLVAAMESAEHTVIATDLYIHEEPDGIDFLTHDRVKCDAIVTNPPFSDKDKFIARCYELDKPWALLLPVTAIGGQRRQKMYRRHGLQILMLGRRVNFETPSGKGGGAWQEHAWFTWKLSLPKDIVFSQID